MTAEIIFKDIECEKMFLSFDTNEKEEFSKDLRNILDKSINIFKESGKSSIEIVSNQRFTNNRHLRLILVVYEDESEIIMYIEKLQEVSIDEYLDNLNSDKHLLDIEEHYKL